MTKNEILNILERAKDKNGEIPMSLVRKAFEKISSEQLEVIRCKRCKYVHYDKEFNNYWCKRMPDVFMVEKDGLCKWAH